MSSDKALIYLYRTGSVAGAATAWKVYANNRHIVSLENSGYYPYFTEPGRITFAKKMQVNPLNVGVVSLTDPKLNVLTLDAAAGETYYVRFKLGLGKVTMEQVTAEVGLNQVIRCGLLRGVEVTAEE
ncbi:MAG: DUF2846 domain-containing protein [Verrucomicrobia bacterium]|nr:DUF2846 domain-containing protein [Verrucomicrobiota bacterium]